MKKLKIMLSFLLVFVFVSTPIFASNNNLTLYIDNKKVNAREVPILLNGEKVNPNKEKPTFILGNYTYVPIRFIAEKYGSKVDWNQEKKSVIIENGTTKMVMNINSRKVFVNGVSSTIDEKSVPRLVRPEGVKDASTMVPLRFVSDVLGFEVDYDENLRIPIINTKTDGNNAGGNGGNTSQEKPANLIGISDIHLIRGSSGLYKLNIKSAARLNLSHKQVGNKINIVANNAKLNNKGLENLKLTGDPISSVSIREVGNNVEISISLSDTYSYNIDSYQSGKEYLISPVSRIKSINKEQVNGKDAIVIYRDNNTRINRMTLNNPKRFVFDIMDSTLGYGYKEYNLKTGNIMNVRASQYTPDKNYHAKDRIVRVVLDMKTNVANDALDVKEYKDKIVITEKSVLAEKPSQPKPKPNPKGKTIVIDAGHGGHDSGAVSNGTKEKDIALAVSKKVEGILKGRGFNVIMTRTDDTFVSLGGRSKLANDADADLFVSIHANSFSGSAANGIETLHSGSESSKKLSQGIQDELIKGTGAVDRGIKHRPNLAVLRNTKMPAALVELGFITNPSEVSKLKSESYQNKLAKAIADGISNYFK